MSRWLAAWTGRKSKHPAQRGQVSFKNANFIGPISHHSSVVYKDKMYLFGGSNDLTSNSTFFSLDLNSFKWDVVKQKVSEKSTDVPSSADEHTAVLNGD